MQIAKQAPAGSGLRERQREQTRALISHAAVELAIERGIANVTVDDIAQAAGVSARTFFNYFPAKRDALFTWTTALDDVAVARFLDEGTADVLADLQALVRAYGATAERGDLHLMHDLLARNPELRPFVRDLFREFEASLAHVVAQRLGVEAGAHEARVLAAVASAMFRASFSEWMAEGGAATLDEAIARSFAVMRRLVRED